MKENSILTHTFRCILKVKVTVCNRFLLQKLQLKEEITDLSVLAHLQLSGLPGQEKFWFVNSLFSIIIDDSDRL